MEEEDKPEREQREDKGRPLQLSDLQTGPPPPPAPPKAPKPAPRSKAQTVRESASKVASRLRNTTGASRAQSKGGTFASRLREEVAGASDGASFQRKQQERGGRRKKKPEIYMTQTK